MSATIKLLQGTPATLVNANGSAISAAARSAASAEYDNTTDLAPFCQVEGIFTFGTGPTAGKRVSLYVVFAPDGTNYIDGSDTVTPSANLLVGWAFVRNVTTAQRVAFIGKSPDGRIHLPAKKCKFIVQNDADQTISANWTLKLYPEFFQSV